MRWPAKFQEKYSVIAISLAVVFAIAALLYLQPPFLNHWIIKLEDDTYDRQIKRYHRPLSPHPSLAIVDIDDKSIAEQGRWPWDRSKLAALTRELQQLGAKVIAFDMIFSELEENPVDILVNAKPSLAAELDPLKSHFDTNALLADALKNSPSFLGFAFASNGKEVGELPQPLLTLSTETAEKTLIPQLNGYIGNQPLFQQAAKQGGFINAMIDADGILRFSPLLMRHQSNVYPALALQAAARFLQTPITAVITSQSGPHHVIEQIQLGSLNIPTDPWGRILIPYRGPPYSFPYLSATDILQQKIAPEQVAGKLIFIGLTATASSDLLATAISPVFPGVEVQATIASGIIDQYLPYKPNWGRAAAIFLVLLLGAFAAFTFPYVSRVTAFLLCVALIAILEALNYWMWTHHSLVLSFFFPLPTLATIFALDLICVYISDREQKKELKRLFGHYMPPEQLEQLIQKKGELILSGEQKQLTILFAQIQNFPTLADTLSTDQLKEYLHIYLTHMNQLIFDEKGLLDKFMRDHIMAFWNAPLPDPDHAYRAVKTALAMQASLPSLNRRLTTLSLPPIQLNIGINTGPCHVGDMGSKYHRSYTAIGRPVDLAFHLKNHLPPFPILVGETTYLATKDRITYHPPQTTQIVGKTEQIYEPVAEQT